MNVSVSEAVIKEVLPKRNVGLSQSLETHGVKIVTVLHSEIVVDTQGLGNLISCQTTNKNNNNLILY